jgi:hypothetical protein
MYAAKGVGWPRGPELSQPGVCAARTALWWGSFGGESQTYLMPT